MKFDFCQFQNSSADTPAELFFYGDIVSDSWSAWIAEDQYPLNVQQLLKEIGNDDLDIHINSCGGDVFAGNAIYNMLRTCAGYKTVYIDGVAASIASVIAMAGDKIIIPENAYLMIHKAWSMGIGNGDDMRKMADTLDKIDQGIVATYMSRTKDQVTDQEIKDLMAEETWLTGAAAEELFANVTAEKAITVAASLNSSCLSQFRNIPKGLPVQGAAPGVVPKPKEASIPEDMQDHVKYLKVMQAAFGE